MAKKKKGIFSTGGMIDRAVVLHTLNFSGVRRLYTLKFKLSFISK